MNNNNNNNDHGQNYDRNKIEHDNIRIMREAGCSYGQIAKVLSAPKSTVSSYCLTHHIKPQLAEGASDAAIGTTDAAKNVSGTPPTFCLCSECQRVFIQKTKRLQSFCSDKCRGRHWRREKAYQDYLEAEAAYIAEKKAEVEAEVEVLNKGLDFLGEESDRWYGDNNACYIGRKKVEVLNE